jgi:hypothetical protein
MKITKNQLRKIIKEEITNEVSEGKAERFPKTSEFLGIDLLNRVFEKEEGLKARADLDHEYSGDGGPYPVLSASFLRALEAVLGEEQEEEQEQS